MSFFPRSLAAQTVDAPPAIQWEEPGCLLCSSRRWSQLIEAPDPLPGSGGLWFAVVQCQDCGLCFTNPRPSFSSILPFYPKVYWPRCAPSPRQKKFPPSPPTQGRFQRRNERRFLPWHGQGRLLDFGCGGGVFLERMHRQGWQVTGLDTSATAIRQVRMELNVAALVGTLPHPDLRPGSFDMVTMWHSLENVHNPREVLRQTYDLLVPGGKLLVAVPNIECLPFRWFRQAWVGLDLPRHLTHFAPRTLRWMLERSGFQVQTIRMVRHSAWVRSSARLACRELRRPHWQTWLQAKPASRLAAWYSYLTRQADCLLATAERVG